MKCFKIILSYILGIILFLTLNLMGVLLIIKNTFNETTLTNIVDNINIYDIVIGKLESLGDYDSNSTIDDIFKKIGNESNISSKVVESVMEDKNVKSTLNDSTKDILLNSYKNVEQKINSDKIQNSVNQAFVKYEEKTGTNIENDLKEKFSDFKDNFKSYFDKYIRYYILGLILMSFSNVIVGFITNSDISNNEEVIRKITNILPIYSLISTCLCAPIIEELLYRKTIGDIFNNKWLGIIIGGLLFGGAHVIGTYTNILDVLYVIPYGVLGSVFMYIYYDSDNIYNTMFLHFMHNSILMILYFVSMIN